MRAALRDLSAHAAAGVPLNDMALLHAATEPYASLLVDHLGAAGVPFSGPGHRRLSASLAGRTLRRLLSLAVNGLERGAVITLLGAAPIDDGSGREVPAAEWNRLSRQAGVIDGDHWMPRLAELAGGLDDDGGQGIDGGALRLRRGAGRATAPADRTQLGGMVGLGCRPARPVPARARRPGPRDPTRHRRQVRGRGRGRGNDRARDRGRFRARTETGRGPGRPRRPDRDRLAGRGADRPRADPHGARRPGHPRRHRGRTHPRHVRVGGGQRVELPPGAGPARRSRGSTSARSIRWPGSTSNESPCSA